MATKKVKKKAKKKVSKKKTAVKKKPAAKQTIESYIARPGGWQSEVMGRLRRICEAASKDVSSGIKWGQPVFESSGPFAYMRPAKAHVTFGFWRGLELSDPKGLLESGGKRMAHVKITGADFDEKQIARWVKEAVALNAKLGSPT